MHKWPVFLLRSGTKICASAAFIFCTHTQRNFDTSPMGSQPSFSALRLNAGSGDFCRSLRIKRAGAGPWI